MFIDNEIIQDDNWQSFERLICRLVKAEGFSGARIVGQSNDHGADIIASKNGRRWLFQAKHWSKKVGLAVIDETLKAATIYKADIPVIVASNGFDEKAKEQQQILMRQRIPLQLWDIQTLVERLKKIPDDEIPNKYPTRDYQEKAIKGIIAAYNREAYKALVVLATGLGKTFVAAEAIHRLYNINPNLHILVLAHTNPLVYQLEREFWKFLNKSQSTLIWNGIEQRKLSQLQNANMVFACVNTIDEYLKKNEVIPTFDIIIVDECHHAGSSMYKNVFDTYHAGTRNGPFLLGLTATPWRPDEIDLQEIFGETVACIDMVEGLKKGFLSNVDYRMYTDNIDWKNLKNLNGQQFSPKQINKTLFIEEWDDSVVYELQKTWSEQKSPRAIIFCGTIEHARIMCSKINALGFCKAAAIFSNSNDGYSMNEFEKNKILTDFSDGMINVVCTIDMFNEGLDVPDVNILVFQRVTHSRRIFIQQLGRGLRISDDKEKVIVLDFVSDIRRFAAGIELKDNLKADSRKATRIKLSNKVTFKKVTGDDPETEKFLRQWLEDISEIEDAGENSAILKFPPLLPGSKE